MNHIKTYVEKAQQNNQSFSEVVLESQVEETGISKDALLKQMEKTYLAMEESLEQGMKNQSRSVSGLTGNDGRKLLEYIEKGNLLGDGLYETIAARALGIAQLNGCMGKIVAAPTAGSCGIVPAVLFTIKEKKNLSKEAMIMSLFTAGGIGNVIAENASISGAQGGCQAECGSSSAMAAGAMVELMGGTPMMCAHAAAISLKGVLGLVCDPVAGLVEVPCIKRNALSAVQAITAAQMALAGIESIIPVDEVIWAMKNVGDQMSPSLKESAKGGLAITPTGLEIAKALREKSLDG